MTVMRKAAFEKDGGVEEVMRNYLMEIPPNHKKSVGDIHITMRSIELNKREHDFYRFLF